MKNLRRMSLLAAAVWVLFAAGVASAGPADQCSIAGFECTDNGDGTLTICRPNGSCTTVFISPTTTTTTVPPTTTTTTTTTTTVPPTTTTVPPTTTTTTTTIPIPTDPVLQGHYDTTVVIPAGDTWTLGNDVTIDGALIVEGVLSATPDDGISGKRTLTFVGIDETTFTDGGPDPDPELNPGLFTVGDGRLDLYGESKGLAWSNDGTYPAEWSGSDELVAAPYLLGDTTFTPWSLGDPIDGIRPEYPREIINLSRSITIQGTVDGRSHWMNRSSQPQNVQWVEFRHMGVRSVSGRYPVHFHQNGDASRGSILYGVLVRDSGHRAYVPHASHGITIAESVAYETTGESFWWDLPLTDTTAAERESHFSDDTDVDRLLIAGQNEFGTGFLVGGGDGNVVTNTTVVANRDGQTCVHWPSQLNGLANVWVVENLTTHNCLHGIDFWQNEMKVHLIDDFVTYSNEIGIDHGAYNNADHYRGGHVFGNELGLRLHARTNGDNADQLTFETTIFEDNVQDVEMAFTNFTGFNARIVFIGGYLESFLWNDARPSLPQNHSGQIATVVDAYDVGGLVESGISEVKAVLPSSDGSRPGSIFVFHDANGDLEWSYETGSLP